MVLLLAKNSKAECLFRPNFLKQVVIEIQKMEHPRQKFSKYPPGSFLKTESSRPMSDQDSNPISCMINITCQSPLENKIFVAISQQNTRTFEFCCLPEETVNCLAK